MWIRMVMDLKLKMAPRCSSIKIMVAVSVTFSLSYSSAQCLSSSGNSCLVSFGQVRAMGIDTTLKSPASRRKEKSEAMSEALHLDLGF
mmetsp:Transcript_79197/g.158168  ORF Transcript_79197/g.158168 Transcript_79197/m.158168 type:complete len:88 (-) Transcript_79197:5-268(-)